MILLYMLWIFIIIITIAIAFALCVIICNLYVLCVNVPNFHEMQTFSFHTYIRRTAADCSLRSSLYACLRSYVCMYYTNNSYTHGTN